METPLIALAARVIAAARHAGLDREDQRAAAEAALIAAMPAEVPAIAHFMVDLLYPGLAGIDGGPNAPSYDPAIAG